MRNGRVSVLLVGKFDRVPKMASEIAPPALLVPTERLCSPDRQVRVDDPGRILMYQTSQQPVISDTVNSTDTP